MSECLLLENLATCDMINDSFIAKPGVEAKPGFQFSRKGWPETRELLILSEKERLSIFLGKGRVNFVIHAQVGGCRQDYDGVPVLLALQFWPKNSLVSQRFFLSWNLLKRVLSFFFTVCYNRWLDMSENSYKVL